MPQNSTGKVTLGDLRTKGLLDLHRQGTTWVAVIRLRDGRLTNLALEESITTRKAALQFLKAELTKLELGPVPNSSAKLAGSQVAPRYSTASNGYVPGLATENRTPW